MARAQEGAQGALGVFIDVTRIERLEQIRQEFLSNVSHELRTPLTAILAFVETLEAGAMDDKESSQRFLSIIRRNAARMQDLIDDILELSAIEAGNVQVRAEHVELYPIVNDVISSLAAKTAAQDIVVTNAVAREAKVYADARRLEQMLTNLVENAIKFNRASGQVKIKYESGDRSTEPGTGTRRQANALARLRIAIRSLLKIPAKVFRRSTWSDYLKGFTASTALVRVRWEAPDSGLPSSST